MPRWTAQSPVRSPIGKSVSAHGVASKASHSMRPVIDEVKLDSGVYVFDHRLERVVLAYGLSTHPANGRGGRHGCG